MQAALRRADLRWLWLGWEGADTAMSPGRHERLRAPQRSTQARHMADTGSVSAAQSSGSVHWHGERFLFWANLWNLSGRNSCWLDGRRDCVLDCGESACRRTQPGQWRDVADILVLESDVHSSRRRSSVHPIFEGV